MIYDFATLSVKKIVPTVIATVPDKKEVRKINETGEDGFFMFFFSVVGFSFGDGRGKELRHVTDKRVQAII